MPLHTAFLFGAARYDFHMRYQLLAILPLFLAIGCSSDTHMFAVSVKNGTGSPLTGNLTKDVPQHEYFLASPGDMVEARVLLVPDDPPGGRLNDLPPGKTASKSMICGHFGEGEHAIMRVYRGKQLTIDELL